MLNKSNNNKKITIEVLDFFLGIPEVFINSFDRTEFYRMLNGMPSERVLSVSNICKLFHSFKKTGYIIVKKTKNGNESIRFTNKAKLTIIDKLAEKEQTGTMYCFISFDIPEELRVNRDKFRRSIKRMGFRQLQKSLWVSNRSIGQLVEMAANEYKVNEYVIYMITNLTNVNQLLPKILSNEKSLNK